MDLSALTKQLDGLNAQMSAAITARDNELKTLGAAREETAKRVDSLGADVIAVKGEIAEKFLKFQEELKNSGVRIDEVEKRLGRGRTGDLAIARGSSDIAKAVADHEFYKSFVARKEKTSQPIPVKSFFPHMAAEAVKATVTLDAAGGDAIAPPLRTGIVAMQQRQLRLRDLMPVRPISVNTVEYLEETAFGLEGGTASVSSITRSSSTATVTTAAAHGLVDGDLVRISGATQTEYNVDAYVTVTGATTFTYTVSGTPATPATGTILWQKLNSYGPAGTVAEGALKPEALLEFVLRQANAQVIAAFLAATRQVLDDATQLRAYIDDRLLYSVAYAEEQQILYGSGTGTNLQGILTHPRIQSYLWSSGETTPVPDTKIDAIRRAMTKAHVREYAPTGAVLNPQDWEDVELAKGSDGHYLWLQIASGVGTRIFQMPVVVTNAIQPGDGLVGAFANGAALWDREDANIRVSEEHSDYFRRNMVGILAEERLALTIFRPDSFVAIDFDAEPS